MFSCSPLHLALGPCSLLPSELWFTKAGLANGKNHLGRVRAAHSLAGWQVCDTCTATPASQNKSGAVALSAGAQVWPSHLTTGRNFYIWSNHFPVKYSWMELAVSEPEEKNKVSPFNSGIFWAVLIWGHHTKLCKTRSFGQKRTSTQQRSANAPEQQCVLSINFRWNGCFTSVRTR